MKEDRIMVPTPLFYQLLVVALVLICLFIHVRLPDKPLPRPQPPLASNKRRRAVYLHSADQYPGSTGHEMTIACAEDGKRLGW